MNARPWAKATPGQDATHTGGRRSRRQRTMTRESVAAVATHPRRRPAALLMCCGVLIPSTACTQRALLSQCTSYDKRPHWCDPAVAGDGTTGPEDDVDASPELVFAKPIIVSSAVT